MNENINKLYYEFILKVWIQSLKTEKYMKDNIILLKNNKLSEKEIQEINNKIQLYFMFTKFDIKNLTNKK